MKKLFSLVYMLCFLLNCKGAILFLILQMPCYLSECLLRKEHNVMRDCPKACIFNSTDAQLFAGVFADKSTI